MSFYSPLLTKQRQRLRMDLSHAIENGELTLHYQPQFHLKLDDAADEPVKGALTHASAA